VGEGTERWGCWVAGYAVLGIIVDPEDFAAARCDAEIGRKVGEWNGEMAWYGCGAGRGGRGEGRLGLEADTDNIEGRDYLRGC